MLIIMRTLIVPSFDLVVLRHAFALLTSYFFSLCSFYEILRGRNFMWSMNLYFFCSHMQKIRKILYEFFELSNLKFVS